MLLAGRFDGGEDLFLVLGVLLPIEQLFHLLAVRVAMRALLADVADEAAVGRLLHQRGVVLVGMVGEILGLPDFVELKHGGGGPGGRGQEHSDQKDQTDVAHRKTLREIFQWRGLPSAAGGRTVAAAAAAGIPSNHALKPAIVNRRGGRRRGQILVLSRPEYRSGRGRTATRRRTATAVTTITP